MEPESTIKNEIADTSMTRPHVVVLGAGASLAAFPEGDRNGKKLPLMNNLVDVLDLGSPLRYHGIDYESSDFENIYSKIYGNSDYMDLCQSIEERLFEYFDSLRLPDTPTIYDHLVLSLRDKDLIASFNWDPLLYQACVRNNSKIKLPKVVFLHGNVAVGYCTKDKSAGYVYQNCRKCGQPFTLSPLLYPINNKNYGDDPFISSAWERLRYWLKNAFMLTIFGYSGPASDAEAIGLMKQGWGYPATREYEELEIIDVKKEDELCITWHDFIHSHHYQIRMDFYDSWIARHPRRTCEAMWNQTQEIQFLDDNWIPKELSLPELWKWLEKFKSAESA